jgi:uncharacterized OsmC-like protein
VRVSRKASGTDTDKTIFFIETELHGELSKREKILLFNSARKCDVSKLLAGEVCFEYQLVEDANP